MFVFAVPASMLLKTASKRNHWSTLTMAHGGTAIDVSREFEADDSQEEPSTLHHGDAPSWKSGLSS